MSTPLQPVILEAGLAAVWRATNDGVAAQITHIALGDAGYVPFQSQVGMRSERVRYPVADGSRVSPRQIHLTALADGATEFWVREAAFILSDGTVFAVWSHPTTALAYKSANVDLLLAYDLELTAVPAGSVVVESTGAGLNLALSAELAALAAAQVSGMLRDLHQQDRLTAVEGRAGGLEQARDQMRTDLEKARAYTAKVEAETDTLGKVAAWQSESQAEVLRGMGQSGLYLTRGYTFGGNAAFDRPFAENWNPAGIHNHPNYDGMPGTAEFSTIVNGYYLRTRHNDYLLRRPANAGSAFLATEAVSAPALPAAVANAGDVAAQIAAMRGLFADYAAGQWPAGFGWTLSYVEFWFEPLSAAVGDTFDSFRHQQRISDLDSAFREAMRYNAGGYKDRFENVPYEPPVVRWIENGKPVLARLRYRIAAVDVSHLGDLRPHIETVDDPAYRQGFGRDSGRFRVLEGDNAPGKLDELMAAIPGLDGAGANLAETYREYGIDTTIRRWDGAAATNAAYYNRFARAWADAANRDAFHRGFNDPTLFAALTTRGEVLPMGMDGRVYRFSYAIPFELVLRTPLEGWNPHGLPEAGNLSGAGSQADPYNGWRRDGTFYRVPTAFYSGGAPGDAADTGMADAWVSDGGGTARSVKGSGIYVGLPEIAGIGSIRVRHPIYPVFHEGSHAFAELQGLRREQGETLASLATSLIDTQRRQIAPLTV